MKNDGLRKLHRLFDEASGNWFDTYAAPGIDVREITADVPREECTWRVVRRYLMRKGADETGLGETAIEVAIAEEAPVLHRAARTGWRNNYQQFASHVFVAGHSAGTVLPPDTPIGCLTGQIAMCGTLEGWQELVRPARYSTAMMTVLGAAFAAPLLTLLDMPNFGLVLTGLARTGKSTAQLAGASAFGFGKDLDMPDLNATPAGLLSAAVAFNCHMMPINEIGTSRGAKRKIYVDLRERTYSLMSGRDVLRHPSWNGGGETGTFRTILVLSSEHSPDVWAARNGEVRDDGETARLIGLPAVFPGGCTVFDRAPESVPDAELMAWGTGQCIRMAKGFPHQRGVAFKRYIDYILSDIPARKARAQHLIDLFDDQTARSEYSPVARDIVRKFGVVFAGGVMAIEAGVLPLKGRELGPAIQDACKDALAALPDPERNLREDVRLLIDKLSGGSVVDVDQCSAKDLTLLPEADGFVRKSRRGRLYAIRGRSLLEWFGPPSKSVCLLEKLDEEGLLLHSRGGSHNGKIEWAEKQIEWPHGPRVRSVCIDLPDGLSDLERYC